MKIKIHIYKNNEMIDLLKIMKGKNKSLSND